MLSFQQVQAFTVSPITRSAVRQNVAFMSAVADEEKAKAAEERARMAMEAENLANASTESIGIKDNKLMDLGGRPFPLSMIVGQDNIKQALLLASINSRMGGVVISGGKGTAKSVMARALHQLLPPIEVIKGSPFNSIPKENLDWMILQKPTLITEALHLQKGKRKLFLVLLFKYP